MKFELITLPNGTVQFTLKAKNGAILMLSGMYGTMASAEQAIRKIQRWAGEAEVVRK